MKQGKRKRKIKARREIKKKGFHLCTAYEIFFFSFTPIHSIYPIRDPSIIPYLSLSLSSPLLLLSSHPSRTSLSLVVVLALAHPALTFGFLFLRIQESAVSWVAWRWRSLGDCLCLIDWLIDWRKMTVEERQGRVGGHGVSGGGGGRDQFPVGMRVLAVDDDPTCLKILENLLLRCQYHGMLLICNLSLSRARASERASSLHGCGLSLCCIDQFFFRFGLVLFYSCFFSLSLLDLIFVFFGDALVLLCLAFTVSLVDVSVVLGGLFLRPCNVNSRTGFAPFLLKKVFFPSLFFDIISTLLSESPILSTVLWVAHMVVV
jgi:hypothetical protein